MADSTLVATAKAVLTIPGTTPQKLHVPAVTLAAWYTSVVAIIVAVAPMLPALHGALVTLCGGNETLAGQISAAITIIAAVFSARAGHVAATGRSIIPAVDNNPQGDSPPSP